MDTEQHLIDRLNRLGDGSVNALGNTNTPVVIPDPQGWENPGGSGLAPSITTMTLTGTIASITLPSPANAGKRVAVRVKQDGTGSRLVTAWATPTGAIRWPGAAAPTLTTTANRQDHVEFEADGTDWIATRVTLNIG